MENFLEQREAVASTMRKVYQRGLTTVSGGNISFRLNEELFCITASAFDKSSITGEQVAIVGFDGTNHTPNLKLSIESEMHRLVLMSRPDINAVVHSHPVYASTFSAVEGEKCEILTRLTAEAYYFMGDVVNTPYKLMGTQSLADIVSTYIKDYDVMLMRNHGAIVVAKDLLGGFDKMDLLERAAQMTVVAKQLEASGLKVNELSESQSKDIEALW